MFKKLSAWISGVIRRELEVLETLIAKEFVRLDQKHASDLADLKARIDEVGRFVNTAHDDTQAIIRAELSTLEEHVTSQVGAGMVKRYDQIVDDAARAAYAAIHEARKTLRLPCSLCGQLSWKFNISAIERKPVCLDCEAKGKHQ